MFPYANELTLFESIPRAFTNGSDFKYSRMYIQFLSSVSMKSDLYRIAVYHLWGYIYDLGEILWKLRCMVKGARAQKIGLKSTYLKMIKVRVLAKKCDVKWLTLNKCWLHILKDETCMIYKVNSFCVRAQENDFLFILNGILEFFLQN